MKRILVGIDGSRESLQAAVIAANLAHATHREMELAYVLPEAAPVGPEAFSAEMAVWRKDIAEGGNKILHEAQERSARPDTPSRTTLIEGKPAEALAQLAREPDVDLVVVGHRGRNAVARLMLGSVADRLVQISPKPVLVVR